MKFAGRYIFTLLLVSISFEMMAQQPISNLRKKTLAVNTSDSLVVDTLSIVPGAFQIAGVAEQDYRLDFINSIIYWKNKPAADSVYLVYRFFHYKLNPVAQRMVYDSIMNNMALVHYDPTEREGGGVFSFGNLKADGSFGRQIAFGNSQDAVLNSTLNMQLSGMLGDSIEIQAAITDNNIPIQPDGNTQQLNEFDQVYLRFSKNNLPAGQAGWQLSLGDIDLREKDNYFLNFYKRLQGISFETKNSLSPNISSRTLTSGSIAKGKFTRNIIQGLEGNQGPYRLTGANNEFFFIVLAGTERVFIDGQLMQRGEDQDYVINYNTAEISFTPRRMITKDSRVQVEFEYADRNFLNANFYLAQSFDFSQKLKIRIGAFTNTDAKNSSINQVLDNQQKQYLSGIGDSIQLAFYPAASLDTFAANKILYEKVYYQNGAVTDSFYQYSTDASVAIYRLSFINVGAGRGDYIPDFNGANGKVYKFIPPDVLGRKGSYAPVVLLVTPKKQQLITLGADYAVNKNTLLKTELAMSNYDVNTFSKINNGDDKGFAAKFQLANSKSLKEKNKLRLETGADYEYVNQKFRPLERLRPVEFSRDWVLPFLIKPETENIIRLSAGLRSDKSLHQYRFTNYKRGDSYSGFQNSIQQQTTWKGWQLNNQLVLTNFDLAKDKGYFWRPTLDMSRQFKDLKNWRLGVVYTKEHNAVKNINTDTLTPVAFSFSNYAFYLRSDEAKKNKIGFNFFTRTDHYARGKDFIRGDRSLNFNVQGELLASDKRQLLFNATYRKLKVYEETLSDHEEDESILGRIEYNMNEWKGLFAGNILYEAGAGQEQKRDIVYFEVPAGTGQYAWIDYNEDSVQQLNEFELAAFPDQAKFMRLFTPTNEFIKANYITFNYSFGLNPNMIWKKDDANPLHRFLGRFNYLTSLQINSKSLAQSVLQLNPFAHSIDDTALITMNTIINNTVSFNRLSTSWGMDITNMRNRGKALLTYGYESRELQDWLLKFRWNISKTLAFNLQGRKGNNSLFTPNNRFENRNYDLDIYAVEPVLSFVKGTSFRISFSYELESKKNKPVYGNEKALANVLQVETKYNILQSSSIGGRFSFHSIDYRSATTGTTTTSYIMLDGLQPGSNLLWNIDLTKRLLNNLELNFQYDGRKPAASRTVHTGRVSLMALF